jgi:hypothetical protein
MRCATNDAGFGRLLTLGEDGKSLGAFNDDIRITDPRSEGIGCGRPAALSLYLLKQEAARISQQRPTR